jgi:hypothetical protein
VRNLIQAGLAILVVLCLPASPALADAYISGSDLYEKCRGQDAPDRALCFGYIAGIADAMDLAAPGRLGEWRACVPKEVTVGQLTDMATKWLAAHPALGTRGVAGLVARAFQEAFPCKT